MENKKIIHFCPYTPENDHHCHPGFCMTDPFLNPHSFVIEQLYLVVTGMWLQLLNIAPKIRTASPNCIKNVFFSKICNRAALPCHSGHFLGDTAQKPIIFLINFLQLVHYLSLSHLILSFVPQVHSVSAILNMRTALQRIL
jgi:hypothetical protein